jgi:hypothetical protein
MNNTYIEQFFMLTEKNIEGDKNYYLKQEINKFSIGQSAESHKKKLVKILSIYMPFLVAIIFTSFLILKLPNKSTLSSQPLPKMTVNKILASKSIKISSYIPEFRLFAKRQMLMNISLKKVDLALLDEDLIEKELDTNMPLMDKVIFVPKLFG